MATVALATAIVCQVFAQQQPNIALVGFLLSGVVFVAALRGVPEFVPEPAVHDAPPSEWLIRSSRFRAAMALTAMVTLVFAYLGFAGNRFTTSAVVLWAAGALCFFLAVWQKDRERASNGVTAQSETVHSLGIRPHHVALLGIVALAVFFRFHHLGLTPIEMTSDHAEKLLDVRDVLLGERPVFFIRNTGRECVQFYLTAVLIWLTPLELGHLALKVGTAFVGVLAIPFTYLLGKELYGRQIGLLAAALLAMAHWHVAIARVGLRFPFTAAFATPTLYFLFRAFRHNRRRDWVFSGAFLGIGLHTYIPMRIVPLLLVVLCLTKLVLDWSDRRAGREPQPSGLRLDFWFNAGIGALTAWLFFLPLFRFMVDEPKRFWLRATSRSIGNELSLAEAVDTFLLNVKNAFWMFNFKGDVVPINTIGWSPVLGWVTGAAFVLGLASLYWTMIVRRDRRSLYLLIVLFVLLLPSILSLSFVGENPSVVRAGGAPPVAVLIAAVALHGWMSSLGRFGRGLGHPAGRWLAPAALAMILIASGIYNYHWYFVRYHRQFIEAVNNPRDLAAVVREWIESGGSLENAHHVTYTHWVDTRLVGVYLGNIDWKGAVRQHNLLPFNPADGAARLYLLHPDDIASRERLEGAFPQGHWHRQSSLDPGLVRDFVVFEVPAENL